MDSQAHRGPETGDRNLEDHDADADVDADA